MYSIINYNFCIMNKSPNTVDEFEVFDEDVLILKESRHDSERGSTSSRKKKRYEKLKFVKLDNEIEMSVGEDNCDANGDIDNDSLKFILGTMGKEKRNRISLQQSRLLSGIQDRKEKEQVQFAQYSTSATSSIETPRNSSMGQDHATTSSSHVASDIWNNVKFLNEQEKSKLNELEQLTTRLTAGATLTLYRNILGYSRAMVRDINKDRDTRTVVGSQNFVKLLAALGECLYNCNLEVISSLSLESPRTDRKKAYEKIAKDMNFRKGTKDAYSLHLLTWLSTGMIDDFQLTYGDKKGIHYSVAFHVWKSAKNFD